MKHWIARVILTLVLLIVGLQAGAGEITPINAIIAAPVNYDGKEVTLRGIPKSPTRLPLINFKAYVLEDSSGEITVLTEADLPNMNEEITIRAVVKSLAIVKGEAVGLTVTELERYQQIQKL